MANSRNTDTQKIEKGLEKILEPFQEFVHSQTTASVWLLICTVIALVLVNSGYSHNYFELFHTRLGLILGEISFSMSLSHWINEGLMALFFFLLGMEIKREVLVGDIREFDKLVPIGFAALGGMLVPASIYYAFSHGTPYASGWGITMATDTAFAVGVLALLGKKIPLSAFTFLTALAILDDLGAILVITLFYSDSLDYAYLGISFAVLLALILCNISGIRRPSIYFCIGVVLWAAMLKSGIHATVAGILVASSVPARAARKPTWFLTYTASLVSKFSRLERDRSKDAPILGEPEQHRVVEKIRHASEKASTPLRRWEGAFEHPVALFILPVFALANAGIPISGIDMASVWSDPLVLGIILGLVVGKCLGISAFTWIALKLKLGSLPQGLDMRHVIGLGLLGGIGFTMSIFITNLGFETMDDVLNRAKFSILLGSFIAGVAAFIWFRVIPKSAANDTD
ncbi:MAG: NhaA family Na+:H+ antiporter [Pseudohongiellaceae bacterium]|jgi:NhaA family Na+:H+ antiporter